MVKFIKNGISDFLTIVLVFTLVTAWIFSGWPRIWQKPAIPPGVQTAEAAAPTFVATGTCAGAIAAITPGMPAGVLANDILLLFLETADQAITVSGGTETWAEVTDSPQSVTGATRLTVFWARASQDAPTSPTTSDSGNHQIGCIIAVRGAITSGNPWDVTSGGIEAVSDTTGSITGDTTTVAETFVVAAMATDLPDDNGTTNFDVWANTDLTSVAERADYTKNSGDGGGLGVATGEKAAAGAYGATTVTLANAAQKAFITIALKPPLAPTVSCDTDPASMAFPTLTISDVYTATGGLGNYASTTMTCDYAGGCTLYINDAGDGANPGLATSSPAYLIGSATETLIAGVEEGYGLQATTTAAGSGGTLTISVTYDRTGNDVGGMATTTVEAASSTAAITNREVLVTHKAAIIPLTIAGNYEDTITYSCVGN